MRRRREREEGRVGGLLTRRGLALPTNTVHGAGRGTRRLATGGDATVTVVPARAAPARRALPHALLSLSLSLIVCAIEVRFSSSTSSRQEVLVEAERASARSSSLHAREMAGSRSATVASRAFLGSVCWTRASGRVECVHAGESRCESGSWVSGARGGRRRRGRGMTTRRRCEGSGAARGGAAGG